MTDNATDFATGDPVGAQRPKEPGKLYRRLHANPVLALTTKIVVAVVGILVTLTGVVMLVTPGPAFVLIPLGLAILSTEFLFARRWLEWARAKAENAKRHSDAMDPAVRRRRLVLTGLVVLVVVALVAWYVAVYDWPSRAVNSWNWVQSLAGWMPELPGM